MLYPLLGRLALGTVLLASHGSTPKPGHRCCSRAAVSAGPGGAGATAMRLSVDSVVQFRLRDQFGRVHDAADYRGRTVYLVGAGRGGRTSATAWAAALGPLARGADGRGGAVVPIADLQGVPRLLRGLVRGRFPRAPGTAVLLDWDGAVSQRLGFDPAQSTVLVLAPDGRPVLRADVSGVDTAAAASFVQRARGAVDGAATSGSSAAPHKR